MCVLCVFFFRQKTAYEMRISDWSSDVCSSVLPAYSGVRGSPDLKANSIALDGSSLIILASLDLIELVTARWIVTIAHSTLGWLFGERQRLAFQDRKSTRLNSSH